MLKRSPSLTEQVKVALKQRIFNAEYDDGRIPAEQELAEELGVSRATIREALSRLENEGVIWRRQGSGTFVNPPGLQIKTRLEEIWSYEDVLRAHGFTPSTEVLGMAEMPASATATHDLNLPPNASLLTVHKLFNEDETPVILTVNQIPTTLIKKAYTIDDFCSPVYEFLWEKCRQQLSYYISEIVPLMAGAEIAGWLGINAGMPLITFQETGYNDSNQPILIAQSYFRDDLLRLKLIRRKT